MVIPMSLPPTTERSSTSWFTIIIIAGLFYLVGQYIASQPQRVSQEQEAEREISVQGRGEIQARPDIAEFTMGVQTGPQPSAEAAMKLLTERFNAVAEGLQQSGIKEEDIKTTNLSIQPIYDFLEGRQSLRGFEASENVTVKIRDLATIGDVLARATSQGINQASGISFTIDDPSTLQLEAQTAAIKDARDKAEELAKVLGVSLGRVKGFNASAAGKEPPVFFDAQLERAQAGSAGAGPTVPSGSQEIISEVTITYELR
jgi:uncharacterized protein YggE